MEAASKAETQPPPPRRQPSSSAVPTRTSSEMSSADVSHEADAQGTKISEELPPRPTIITQAASTSNILNPASFTSALSHQQSSLNPNASAGGRLSRTGLGSGSGYSHELEGIGEQVREEGVVANTARPTAFAPFFTLVNDVTTNSTCHPRRIHYLFSDDDVSEELNAALLRSVGIVDVDGGEEVGDQDEDGDDSQMPTTGTSSSSSNATFMKRRTVRREEKKEARHQKEREERVIIVDMNSSGTGIDNISSLSSNWQILNAELGKAPTWDGADPQPEAEDDAVGAAGNTGGLMLKIEGTGVPGLSETLDDVTVGGGKAAGEGLGIGGIKMKDSEKEREIGEEEMQSLLEGFDRKMELLRRVVGMNVKERERVYSRDSASGVGGGGAVAAAAAAGDVGTDVGIAGGEGGE